MVRKKLAVAVATIGALQANLVSALGMGEFDLKSALNQPLNAEIKLNNTRDLDESQVKISLAGREDFERAGVARDYFLTNLKFTVELDDRGQGVIKVTSRDPVIEPYLNFLVEARWPTGRLLREYTVLLDLPVFSESDAAPVSTATTATATSSAQPSPVATSASVPAMTKGRSDRQMLNEGALQAGEKYRVKQNDTLWEIAAKSRPARDVSVQQTMVSIQRLNQNAFIDGNINRLKAGYVLRLPTAAEITEISGRQAVQEVAAQNRAWKTGDTASANTGGAQLDATSTATDSDSGYAEDARLSIATAGDSSASNGGVGSGQGVAALQGELDASQENLDAAKRENTELQGRLDDMEAKIATLQRLLELKDDQLAALQGGAAISQEEAEAQQAEVMEADVDASSGMGQELADAEEAMTDTDTTDTETEAELAETTPAVVEQTQPEPAKPAPKPQPAPEPSFVDNLLANPLYLGGAGAIILALAALVVMRKRKAAEEEEDATDLGIFDEPSDELADVSLDSGSDLELEDSEEEPDNADLLAAELEQEIAADNAEAGDADEEPSSVVQSETGDAIAEADIYIAYGRYQQAIDLLTTAISQEPSRSDLRVKLLEVYVETRDKPDFQQQFVALQALGDDDAVNQVKEMLSSVDGVADWLDDLPGAVGDDFSDADMDAELIDDGDDTFSEPEEELDIDLDLDDLGSTQEFDAVSDADLELDDELDLDLDLESSEDTVSEQATAMFDAVAEPEADTTEESTAELDLDLGEELDLDDELDLGEELSAEQPAAEEELDLDLGGEDESLDLGDLESDTLETELDLGDLDTQDNLEPAATEEGLDLDLDADGDLDLDLGDLGDTDLSELEAEFGDAGSDEVAAPAAETAAEETETSGLDLNLDAADSLEDDVDLEDLDISQGETVTLDTGGDTLDFEAELDAELDSLDFSATDEQPVTEEPASEAPTASDELQLTDSDDFALDEQPATPVTDESVNASPATDDEFDFLADTDEVATKLDLARAYIDMGDTEGAKDILDEVMQEGNDDQKQEANSLLERV